MRKAEPHIELGYYSMKFLVRETEVLASCNPRNFQLPGTEDQYSDLIKEWDRAHEHRNKINGQIFRLGTRMTSPCILKISTLLSYIDHFIEWYTFKHSQFLEILEKGRVKWGTGWEKDMELGRMAQKNLRMWTPQLETMIEFRACVSHKFGFGKKLPIKYVWWMEKDEYKSEK